MRKVIPTLLSVFKYILAGYLMYAGIVTIIDPVILDSKLAIVFENSLIITTLGVIFFISGLTLFLGKLLKKMRVIGIGLFAIYSCFLFASILIWVGFGWQDALGNIAGTLIVGGLYLRWKRLYREKKVLDMTHDEVIGLETDGDGDASMA